jgi:MHS family alpha-ketoglutarate permease-like MFS transporter
MGGRDVTIATQPSSAVVASDAKDRWRRITAIIAASSGNLVEWYDFYVYSYTAIYFAAAFFPTGDQTSQLLNAAGIFALGFFMRPLGGWLFGRIADRHGRRSAMMLSVLLMCAGSLVIGILPTYAKIGAAAPSLLLLARLAQGLSVGGEYGTSATYMSEIAIAGQRGFYASFQYVTLIGGQLTALLVLVLVQQAVPSEDIKAWAWRVPFLIGGFLAFVAFFLRRSLTETASDQSRNDGSAGTIRALSRHKRSLALVLGFTAGGSLIFYTFTTYMPKYLVNTSGMNPQTANQLMTIALLVYLLLQPVFGALSDRIGRRNSMIWFAGLAVLTTVPLLRALGTVNSSGRALSLVLVGLTIISFYTSISGLVKAELFPIKVRALGVGLAYAIGNALFGGTAEYVALWFKSSGAEWYFAWYVTALCAVALIASILMPDTRQDGFLDKDSESR